MYLKVIPEKKCVCVGGVVKAPPPPYCSAVLAISVPSVSSRFLLFILLNTRMAEQGGLLPSIFLTRGLNPPPPQYF